VIDDPLQYHFAFNWTQTPQVAAPEHSISETVFKTPNGQPAPVKVLTLPVSKNTLLLRVENLADLFDYPPTATLADTVVYVDLQQLAKDLYFKANGAAGQLNGVNIIETQMTATESYADMNKNKFKWTGLDDNIVVEPTIPKDLPNYVVALAG
jgi:hypothetical protein